MFCSRYDHHTKKIHHRWRREDVGPWVAMPFGGYMFGFHRVHQRSKAPDLRLGALCVCKQTHFAHPAINRVVFDRCSRSSTTDVVVCIHLDLFSRSLASTGSNQAYRTISTGQLNALQRLHLRPIDEVVYLGPQGYLVLRGASRLDAFSGYPVRS